MKKQRKIDKKIRNVMSNLYWKCRKKGLNHRKAFIDVGRKAIALKVKNPYGNKDKDNKVNRYDCQPKNKYKQDAQKDINSIYNLEKEDLIDFDEKELNKNYEKAKSRFDKTPNRDDLIIMEKTLKIQQELHDKNKEKAKEIDELIKNKNYKVAKEKGKDYDKYKNKITTLIK